MAATGGKWPQGEIPTDTEVVFSKCRHNRYGELGIVVVVVVVVVVVFLP